MEWILLVQTRNVGLVTNISTAEYLIAWQVIGNLEIAEVLRDYVASNPQREQSKKIGNDQELIQSDPISCPQNQKGNN